MRKILIFFTISLHFFIKKVKCLSPNEDSVCAVLNEEIKMCGACGPKYYLRSQAIRYFSPSDCAPHLNSTYTRTIYVSNKPCAAGVTCTGSKTLPYESLLTAWFTESQLATKYISSNLTFYLLGSPHFILKKHANATMGSVFLFRQTPTFINVLPFYCSIERVDGCLENEMESVLVYIKIDYFLNLTFKY